VIAASLFFHDTPDGLKQEIIDTQIHILSSLSSTTSLINHRKPKPQLLQMFF